MGVKAVTICPLCHPRALVPTFVLEWRKFGAPDRMKLSTTMSLLSKLFVEATAARDLWKRSAIDPMRTLPWLAPQAALLNFHLLRACAI